MCWLSTFHTFIHFSGHPQSVPLGSLASRFKKHGDLLPPGNTVLLGCEHEKKLPKSWVLHYTILYVSALSSKIECLGKENQSNKSGTSRWLSRAIETGPSQWHWKMSLDYFRWLVVELPAEKVCGMGWEGHIWEGILQPQGRSSIGTPIQDQLTQNGPWMYLLHYMPARQQCDQTPTG